MSFMLNTDICIQMQRRLRHMQIKTIHSYLNSKSEEFQLRKIWQAYLHIAVQSDWNIICRIAQSLKQTTIILYPHMTVSYLILKIKYEWIVISATRILRLHLHGNGSLLIRYEIDRISLPSIRIRNGPMHTLLLRYPHQFWSCSESQLVSFGSLLC